MEKVLACCLCSSQLSLQLLLSCTTAEYFIDFICVMSSHQKKLHRRFDVSLTFWWRRGRTRTRPLFSPPSPPHYLLLPVSLKGREMKYSEGAVSAQCASISGLIAGTLRCFKEAETLQVTGLAEQQVKPFSSAVQWLIWIIGSQWTLSFPIKFTNRITSWPSALPCVVMTGWSFCRYWLISF